MKKFISVLCSFVLIMGMAQSALAIEPVDDESTFSNNQEFDSSMLDNAELVRICDDGSVELKIVKPQRKSKNGYQSMSTTNAKIIPLDDKAKEDLLQVARANNSNYREVVDKSYTVTLYSTTKWETKDVNGREYIRLTGFSGGIDAEGTGSGVGSGIVINSSKITYGALGVGIGEFVSESSNITLSNSSRSYAYSRTTNWVYGLDPNKAIGHSFTVTLKRGNTWDVTLTNNI